MNGIDPDPGRRRALALDAVAALGGHRSEHLRLDVRCRSSHRVAAVYAAGDQLVYTATLGPHSHGDRDRVDHGHGGDPRGRPYADLLDAGADPTAQDGLPASCECGPRTLSRSALQEAITRHDKRIIVD